MASFVDNWKADLKKIVLQPRIFFMKMKMRGGYMEPFQFSLMTSGASALFLGILSFSFANLILILLSAPLIWTIVLFAQSLFSHVYLKIMGGHATYEATFRIFAYMTPFLLLLALMSGTVGKNIFLALTALMLWLYVKYIQINVTAYHHKISLLRAAIALILFPIILSAIFIWSIATLGDVPISQALQAYYAYSI